MRVKETNVKIVTMGIFIATFMTAVEGTIVSTAMPTIVGSLHGMEVMNWVFSIYLLTNAMMTPIYGKLADKIGRKPIFMLGILIFILGSFLCGFSQNMLQLIIFRGIQGGGAGAIMPVALTIIADIYPFEKRAKVLGFTNAAWGIASIAGPLAGGFIVDTIGWHWIFLINVPIGLALMLLMWLFFVEPRYQVSKKKMDFAGSILLMFLLLCIMYGLQLLGDLGFTLQVGVLFSVAALFIVIFIKVEKSAEDPVIALELFGHSGFIVVNLVAALVSGFLIGIDVYIPMWMQGVLGLKAAMGGVVLAPMSIAWILGSLISARFIAKKYTTKQVLMIGIFIVFLGSLQLFLATQATRYIVFFIIASILGIGLGITITTTTVTAQQSVSAKQMGVATSFNTLARTLGQTVMVSLFGLILNNQIHKGIAAETKEGITNDMMNQLVNSETVHELSKELVPTLRNILYQGLHSVYFIGMLLLMIAFLCTCFQKSK